MPDSLSLYQAESELLEALQRAEEGDETALSIIPHYLEYSLDKRDKVATALRIFDQQAEFCDAEIQRLKDRKERVLKVRKRLEQSVMNIMQQRDIAKLEGKTSTFSLRLNPPSVLIEDESALPPEYKFIEQTMRIDKQGIAKALKSGIEVPGADLRVNSIRLEIK